MTRFAKVIVLVLFSAFGCIYFATGSGDEYSTPTASADSGAAVYAAHCAKCHGADGRAKTAKGKRAGATDFTSDWNKDGGRGIRIITNGKGEMPSFKKKLSAAEIQSVFNYVLRF